MNSNWQIYRQLEQAYQSDAFESAIAPQSSQPSLVDRLIEFWQTLSHTYTTTRTAQVHQVSDAQGTWWYVYDPDTQETTFLESPQDLDMWKEARFRGQFDGY
jgi:hypothetical protein